MSEYVLAPVNEYWRPVTGDQYAEAQTLLAQGLVETMEPGLADTELAARIAESR